MKELSYGTLPPRSPDLKRKSDWQWEKCMADGFNYPDLLQRLSLTTHKGVHQTLGIDRRYRFPMKSSFFGNLLKQCCLSHACRDASLEVQRPSRKEQGDNRKQSKKEYNFYSFFSLFLHAQKRMAGVDLFGVELERVLAPSNLAFKSSIDICRSTASHACTFRLGDQATTLNTFKRFDSVSTTGRTTDGQAFFFFLFFFTVDRTTKRVQPPYPRYESSFVCPQRAKFWDDSLYNKQY